MTNEERIIESSKKWQKTEDEHLKEWEQAMIAAVGEDKYRELQEKEYRAELTAEIIRGAIYLIAIAILCATFLYLR